MNVAGFDSARVESSSQIALGVLHAAEVDRCAST